MSTEKNTIHEFEYDFICDFFSRTQRQGPGSPQATLEALRYVDHLTENSRIADLGCGTGGQTMVLARHAPGTVTGLDLFPKFIAQFNLNAAKSGLRNRVKGIVGSMDALPFDERSLDLIWSEGAIYNIGFERGLRLWRDYLKTGGYIAVTENSWFTDERPAEIEDFWMEAYPQIDTVPNQTACIRDAGYQLVAAFPLPETCWTEHYYAPLGKAREEFLAAHAGNRAAEALVAFSRHEEELYHRYKAFYGYTFFIAKKCGQ